MTAHELAEAPAATGQGAAQAPAAPDARGSWWPLAALVVLSVAGVVLRIIVAHQSLFADELSTYWISATHGLGGVLKLLYSVGPIKHAEITPPLYFVLAWATSQLGHSPELLRLPSPDRGHRHHPGRLPARAAHGRPARRYLRGDRCHRLWPHSRSTTRPTRAPMR